MTMNHLVRETVKSAQLIVEASASIPALMIPRGSLLTPSSLLSHSKAFWKSEFPQIQTRLFHSAGPRPSSTQIQAGQRRTFTNFSMRRLERLEASANSEPSNAFKQAEFYKELNKVDSLAVVQRFEAGQFASNEACLKEYITALAKTEKLDKILPAISNSFSAQSSTYIPSATNFSVPVTNFTAQRLAPNAPMHNAAINPSFLGSSPSAAAAAANQGTQAAPVHVVMHEPGLKTQFWKTLRTLALAFLLVSGFSSLVEDRGMPKGLKDGFNISTEVDPNSTNQTYKFSDVHGVDEAKAELEEIVEFLKDPTRFTRLGGKLPKGVLLVGPPGTGKTLLARAVAGEAGVPFLYCSGSEFDEMFVGVGAKRVRELFAKAKMKAPCIIFIDEIDAIGGSRNPKDQQYVRMTLNQLLVELDGFDQNEGIIVVGATNFPESLDKALVRPGRFDRHVVVPIPDVKGREQILIHHAKNIPKSANVDLQVLARGTPGFSGADLENLVNQAAVKASMEGKKEVAMSDFEYAKDKIIMGAERKSAVIDEENRKLVAFHEGGHALVAMFTPGAMPVHKATIMPRGSALGMVSQLPEKDELSWTKKQLLARLDVAMGGRVAEELIFGGDNITSGASSDIEGATRIAQAIVMRFGMSEKVGPVLHKEEDLSKLSPETRLIIEQEVKDLLEGAKQRALKLLTTHRQELDTLAKALLEHETLTKDEIEQVLKGGSPSKKQAALA